MKLKNLLAAILAFAIAFVLAACGDSEKDRSIEPSDTDAGGADLRTYLVLKESTTYNADGSVYQHIKVEQNEEGLPKAAMVEGERQGTVSYTYDGQYAVASLDYDNADGDREYYEFNRSGDNLKKDTYKEGELDSTALYQYDEGGRLINKSYKEPNNSKADKELTYSYKLDDYGRVTEELEYVNGKEYYIKQMEYDDLGNEIRYSGAYIGQEPFIRVSEYDEAGKLQKTTEYTGDVEEACTEYFYDNNGRLLRFVTVKDGVEQAYEEYTYDEKGHVIKFAYYEKSMGERHYEYAYDQNGLLTKESYFIKGELIRYTELVWHSRSVKLEHNVALAIQREFSLLEEA